MTNATLAVMHFDLNRKQKLKTNPYLELRIPPCYQSSYGWADFWPGFGGSENTLYIQFYRDGFWEILYPGSGLWGLPPGTDRTGRTGRT